VLVSDEQRLSIGIPLGVGLARQIELDVVDTAARRVEDQGLAPTAPVVKDEEPLILLDRRPADWLESLARSIPQLGHLRPRAIHHPDRAISTVAVLGMRDRDERLVARKVCDRRCLRVLVDQLRCIARAQNVDRGALVAPRATQDREVAPGRQPGAVRGRKLGRDRLARAAGERLPHPTPELVALLIVEPPHRLARGVEPAGHAIAGAFGSIGDLPVRAGAAVPGVHLEPPARVREIDEVLGIVARPRREADTWRAIAALPRGLDPHSLRSGYHRPSLNSDYGIVVRQVTEGFQLRES